MKAERYFVYTGNAYPHKNLDRLVEAIVLLNKRSLPLRGKKYSVQLKISSSRNIFTERLENLIKKNNAINYIELLGYVPDEKINDFYKNSIAFVFPTLDEGFGLPPKESIEAGTIAIVSDILVLKEVYEDSVFYFNAMDVNSIVKKLEDVINLSASERKKKIDYAQKFLKRYSWKKMAEDTLKIYESVV